MASTISASQIKNWDTLIRRYSCPLILGICVAIFHSNIYPQSYRYLFGTYNDNTKHFAFFPSFKLFGEYHLSLPFIINDCFMLYFFGFVVKHIIESLIPPHGNMYPLIKALPPIISSLFGIISPILLYISAISFLKIINTNQYSFTTLINGCTIPMSTDIALSWTVASFIFNDHLNHTYESSTNNLHETNSCISFLLLLAIFDDIIGLIVVTLFYNSTEKQVIFRPIYILIIILAMFLAFISNKCFKIKKWWYYIFILGGISWIGFVLTAIHPALSLLPIMPFMVMKNKQSGNNINLSQGQVQYNYITNADESEVQSSGDYDYLENIMENEDSSDEETPVPTVSKPYSLSMLDEFEKSVSRFVEYGLFFFTYANAGVQFKRFGNISLCIFFSALFGKILGVSFGAYVTNKLFKIALPFGMKLKHLPLIGFCASANLTLSLIIISAAFSDVKLKDEAKMGSLIAAMFAMCGGVVLRRVIV